MEHRPPRFTAGMKTCLIALLQEMYRNLYWLILALAFALLLWLAPKVDATERMVKNERCYSMSGMWS